MVEYSYDEAEKLLQENLAAAKAKLVRRVHSASSLARRICTSTRCSISLGRAASMQADNSEDLAFLRDQVITAEVNLARVYNYDVKQRRAAKLAESATA